MLCNLNATTLYPLAGAKHLCCRFVQQSHLRRAASMQAALCTKPSPSRYAEHSAVAKQCHLMPVQPYGQAARLAAPCASCIVVQISMRLVHVKVLLPCRWCNKTLNVVSVALLCTQVSLTNPTDKPLHLRAVYGCCSLLGPATFVAPAGPGTEATFECYYAPLMQGHEGGVLRLVSREVSLLACDPSCS